MSMTAKRPKYRDRAADILLDTLRAAFDIFWRLFPVVDVAKGHRLSPPKRPNSRKIVRHRRKQDVEKGDLEI